MTKNAFPIFFFSSPLLTTGSPSTSHGMNNSNRMGATGSPSPLESLERESPHDSGLIDPDQMDWLAELQSRGAKVVRVLFPRTANNNKELTVLRYMFTCFFSSSFEHLIVH